MKKVTVTAIISAVMLTIALAVSVNAQAQQDDLHLQLIIALAVSDNAQTQHDDQRRHSEGVKLWGRMDTDKGYIYRYTPNELKLQGYYNPLTGYYLEVDPKDGHLKPRYYIDPSGNVYEFPH